MSFTRHRPRIQRGALAFCVLVGLVALTLATPLPSVVELDGASCRALLLAERERDVVLLLHEGGAAAAAAAAVADEAARALRLTAASSIVLATLNAAEHGFPAGLHMHHSLPAAVLLPALEGRERVYEHWRDDDEGELAENAHAHAHAHADGETCSGDKHSHGHTGGDTCSGGAGHDHAHAAHAHEHEHGHAEPPLTASGLLRFLRAHSTFAAEVPAAPRASRWAGRSDELWRAVGGGLEALREQMAQLRAERDEARAALAACRAGAGA